MWIAHDQINNLVVGHIFMNVEIDNKIKFLDAWVHSDYRRMGIYRDLWEARWKHVLDNYKDYTVYAWCKPSSLPLLIEMLNIAEEFFINKERVERDTHKKMCY